MHRAHTSSLKQSYLQMHWHSFLLSRFTITITWANNSITFISHDKSKRTICSLTTVLIAFSAAAYIRGQFMKFWNTSSAFEKDMVWDDSSMTAKAVMPWVVREIWWDIYKEEIYIRLKWTPSLCVFTPGTAFWTHMSCMIVFSNIFRYMFLINAGTLQLRLMVNRMC